MRFRNYLLAGIMLSPMAVHGQVSPAGTTAAAVRQASTLPLPPAELYRLKAKVRKALQNSLGVDAAVFITGLPQVDGVTWIEMPVPQGWVRLRLDPEQDAALMDAFFIAQPPIVDPQQAEYFEEVLASLETPGKILAWGTMKKQRDGVRRVQLWVQSDDESGTRRMLQLERRGSSWTLAPYRYDETAFRDLAAYVALQAALDLTTGFGPPWNRLGALEVILKRDRLKPAAYDFVAYEASPIGFDVASEKQLSLPPLVSDHVPYVTINVTTGAIRAEMFN